MKCKDKMPLKQAEPLSYWLLFNNPNLVLLYFAYLQLCVNPQSPKTVLMEKRERELFALL